MVLEEILKHDETFRYQLLSRMVEDCNYYLGYGSRNVEDLWANDEWEQIEICRHCTKVFLLERNRNGSHRTISWDMENGCLLLLKRYRC